MTTAATSILWATILTRRWQLLSAHIALTLTITRSLTLNSAQRSAVQAEPLSVGYNLLKDPTMEMMKILMKVTMRMTMTMMYSCGELQLLASLQASVTRLSVLNAVKAGMRAILMPKNIVAKTRPSSSTQISATRRS